MADLDLSGIPAHIGIIMDGNGRWAQKRGQARSMGHHAGMQALREIVKRADILGVKYLSVYAFSTENWKRPAEEVSGIFKLLVLYVQKYLAELNSNNVKVNILGDWSVLPKTAKDAIELALETTEKNTGLRFNIALNYGGRAEITKAALGLAKKAAAGEINPEDIDERAVAAELFTSGIPDPDLIIRTGGECRLSNFMPWQSAYSELLFANVLWPDFTPEEFDKAIAEYQSRDRRFGGIKA